MSHLRNRAARRLREPFGKAGLTVAILALVMAMVGGAYAAGGLTKSQEKQVTKIAKKYAGKPGAAGVAGTNGTNGTNGKDGAKGENGTDGTSGTNGKSVEVAAAVSSECEGRGGATVQVAGEPTTKKAACNGKNGTTGFTDTLPSGKTETGSWAFGPLATTTPPNVLVASFAIPLEEGLDASHVHFINGAGEEEPNPGVEVPSTQCLGETADPKATAGNLCIYAYRVQTAETGSVVISSPATGEPGTATTGASLLFIPSSVGAEGSGTWAVTAE